MGASSAAAAEGARRAGDTEQAGVVSALRASREAAGAAGERLPWLVVGALPDFAGASAANCERSVGRSFDARIYWCSLFGRSWSTQKFWERVSLGKAHSEAVWEIESNGGKSTTAAGWKGLRNLRVSRQSTIRPLRVLRLSWP